jgi:hypothetical protein
MAEWINLTEQHGSTPSWFMPEAQLLRCLDLWWDDWPAWKVSKAMQAEMLVKARAIIASPQEL